MNVLFTVFIMGLLLLPLGGCEKKQLPVKKPMAEQVKPEVAAQAAKPAEETSTAVPEAYKYDPRGRRDPFLSLVEINKQKPTKKKGATPFESYDIDEIRLLAIAWDKDKYYALVKLPDGKTYTITEGVALGLQGGKVLQITKDTVVIRELIKDYRGEMKSRDSILKLHKGEE
jgi:type IV pilus assembly protein PilP